MISRLGQALGLGVLAFAWTSTVHAQAIDGDAINNFGRSLNIGVGNADAGVRGQLLTDRHIIYSGDPLSVRLRFSQGLDLIDDGEADVHVLIFAPLPAEDPPPSEGGIVGNDGADVDRLPGTDDVLDDAILLPVNAEASTQERSLFSIPAVDGEALPAGTYQLGLIVTNPGGDPLNVNDWYGGLLGLVDTMALTIAVEAVAFDTDGDGVVDDDADGDGFSDPGNAGSTGNSGGGGVIGGSGNSGGGSNGGGGSVLPSQ